MSESRWPVHAGPSEFDPISGQLHLHHTQEDSAEGVRGHFVSILDALRCHQDAQVQQGRGLLLSLRDEIRCQMERQLLQRMDVGRGKRHQPMP